MPVKQLTQRRVVTAGQADDQLIVIHHHLYCASTAIGSRKPLICSATAQQVTKHHRRNPSPRPRRITSPAGGARALHETDAAKSLASVLPRQSHSSDLRPNNSAEQETFGGVVDVLEVDVAFDGPLVPHPRRCLARGRAFRRYG